MSQGSIFNLCGFDLCGWLHSSHISNKPQAQGCGPGEWVSGGKCLSQKSLEICWSQVNWWSVSDEHNIHLGTLLVFVFSVFQVCLKPKLMHITKAPSNLKNSLAFFLSLLCLPEMIQSGYSRSPVQNEALCSPLYAALPAAAQMQTCQYWGDSFLFHLNPRRPPDQFTLVAWGNLKLSLLCACASVVRVCVCLGASL